ncbi:MAG: hypothetical protein K0S08_829 [Gammaproteobacteria bacterium]|jgi:hypothetical protein|nr:hypothetical protein [Gammaproteobacteria bacterium]
MKKLSKVFFIVCCSLFLFSSAQAYVFAAANYQVAQKEIFGFKLPKGFTLFNNIGTPPPKTLQNLTLLIPGEEADPVARIMKKPAPQPKFFVLTDQQKTLFKMAALRELVLVVPQNKAKPVVFTVYAAYPDGAPAGLFAATPVALKDANAQLITEVYPLNFTATTIRPAGEAHFKAGLLVGTPEGLSPQALAWLVQAGKVKPNIISYMQHNYVEIQ